MIISSLFSSFIIPQKQKASNEPATGLPIQICDGELENGREGDPDEVWGVDIGDPLGVREDGEHRPDERAEHEEYVDCGEVVILEPELEPGEGEVENEVEGKW